MPNFNLCREYDVRGGGSGRGGHKTSVNRSRARETTAVMPTQACSRRFSFMPILSLASRQRACKIDVLKEATLLPSRSRLLVSGLSHLQNFQGDAVAISYSELHGLNAR